MILKAQATHYTRSPVNDSYAYIFQPKPILYTCTVRVYLNFDLIVSTNTIFKCGAPSNCILIPEVVYDIIFPKVRCNSMSMDTGGNSTKEIMCPYTLSDTYNDEDAIYGVNAANSMVKLGIYQVLFLNGEIILIWIY